MVRCLRLLRGDRPRMHRYSLVPFQKSALHNRNAGRRMQDYQALCEGNSCIMKGFSLLDNSVRIKCLPTHSMKPALRTACDTPQTLRPLVTNTVSRDQCSPNAA